MYFFNTILYTSILFIFFVASCSQSSSDKKLVAHTQESSSSEVLDCSIDPIAYETIPLIWGSDSSYVVSSTPSSFSIKDKIPSNNPYISRSEPIETVIFHALGIVYSNDSVGKKVFSTSHFENYFTDEERSKKHIKEIFSYIQNRGALELNVDQGYTESQKTSKTKEYSAISYFRLSGETYPLKSYDVRNSIAKGQAVIIVLPFSSDILKKASDTTCWIPSSEELKRKEDFLRGRILESGLSYQSMIISGYEYHKEEIIYEVVDQYTQNQILTFKIKHADLVRWLKESYVVTPTQNDSTMTNRIFLKIHTDALSDEFEWKKISSMTYRSTKYTKKGNTFKIKIKNDLPIFTYLFSVETDKAMEVLYPYTPQYSDWMNTEGVRTIPSSYSLFLNGEGSESEYGILLSNYKLNINHLLNKINSIKRGSPEYKLKKVFGDSILSIDVVSSYGKELRVKKNPIDSLIVPILFRITKR